MLRTDSEEGRASIQVSQKRTFKVFLNRKSSGPLVINKKIFSLHAVDVSLVFLFLLITVIKMCLKDNQIYIS